VTRPTLILALGIFAVVGFSVSGPPGLCAQQTTPSPAKNTPSVPAAPSQSPSAPASSQQPAPPQQAPPVIRTVSQLVQLVAAVTDRHRAFITDLNESDFHILDNGQSEQISYFSRQTDLPLRIALLLDTSNSIRERLHFEQDASIDFLTDVVRRNKDMAFVMTFDNAPEVVQDYTGDMDLLTQAIERQRAGGGTALNDAIYAASQRLVTAPPAPGSDPAVRHVLVVFSDGDDNLSDHAVSEALEMAQRAGVAIYAISTNTDWVALEGSEKGDEKVHKSFKSHGEELLQNFADQTGGRAFFPYKTDDLAVSFQDIGAELRSQYLLAFRPETLVADGSFHILKVTTSRKDLTVRTRKGYYAPSRASVAIGSSPAPGH
jgi:Ca-activated chloride channel family protein